MHLARPFKYWSPAGAAVVFESLARIQRRYFPPMSFLFNSEYNILGNCLESYLKGSRADVMDVEDKDNITWSQQYLVATSTMSMAYQCPPKATQSPKTMFMWILSRYFRCFLSGFPFGRLVIVAKNTIVEGRITELTRLALVITVR